MRRVRRRMLGIVALAAGLTPRPTDAQPPSDTPEAAVRYAENAFEYRDFDEVVEVLWPWLHPPRIVDAQLALRARELLGISLFIAGRSREAEEEFSSLLLLDPDHALDPFLVPPDVIQSFEAVKTAMEPTLRALRDKQPVAPRNPEPPPRVERELVEVPHAATAFVPFGVPQFTLDRPGWGAFWLGTQLGGLALNGAAFWAADGQPASSSDYDVWVALQYAGLGVALASYVGSVIQGSELLRARRQAAERALERPPAADRDRIPP